MARPCPGLREAVPRGKPCHATQAGGAAFPGLSPPGPGVGMRPEAHGGGADAPAHRPGPELRLKPKPGSGCRAWSKTRISSTRKTVSAPRRDGPSWQMQVKGACHALPRPPGKRPP